MNKHVLFILFMITIVFDLSSGIIYRLNETEYEQLPRLFELENYEACLEIPGNVYCVASLELYGDPENEMNKLIQEYSKHTTRHFNYSKLERGVCVQKTCNNYIKDFDTNVDEDLKLILEECLNESMKQKYNLSARVFRMNCDEQTHEGVEVDSADRVVAIVLIAICLACVIGTFYHSMLKNFKDGNVGKGCQALLCFSVSRNLEDLKRVEVGDKKLNELRGLHAIRVLSETVVVLGHVLFTMTGFVSNPHVFEKAFESTLLRFLFSWTGIVQVYFFLAGFFLIYVLQLNAQNYQLSWKKIPLFLFQRWWRLTPPLAISIAFISTWFRHLGSGPLWKYYINNGITRQCKDYYWAHIFYFNNYVTEDRICFLQTWHLASDMQLFIIGIIVYFFIHNKSVTYKFGTLTLLLLIGIASPIAHVWFLDLDAFNMIKPEYVLNILENNQSPHYVMKILRFVSIRWIKDKTHDNYHVLVYNNLTCYIMGMATAYLGYYLHQKKVEIPNFKLGNIFCWLSPSLLSCVFYVGSLYYGEKERPSLMSRILFASSHRVFIGLIASVWTLGIILKFNGLNRTVLEWPGWVVPSKLSYGVFLVHVGILVFWVGSSSNLMTVSFLTLIFVSIGVLFVSYLVAFILYLLVEAPAKQLVNLYMGDLLRKKKNA